MSGDTVLATWIAPGSVQTPDEFAAALKQAVTETAFKGRRTAVVIDHRNLLFHVQETPPVKGGMLGKVLERLVAQSQFFDEPPAWRHLELPPSKSASRCLLALLPQSLVHAIEDAVAALNLDLVSLLPPATLGARHLKRLDAPAEETVILATDLGGSMNIILGRTSGQLLLSRTVTLPGKMQTERAAQELSRTLHYAQQQFGATVTRLFVSGEDAHASLKDASIRDGLKVINASVDDGPLDLPRHAAMLRAKAPFNFASRRSSGAPALRTCAAAGLAAALVVSMVTALHVESSVRAREQQAASAMESFRSDARIQSVAALREREAQMLSACITAVGSTNDVPVAEVFLRALPASLPGVVRLTELTVGQSANGWEFHLKGMVEEETRELSEILDELDRNLQSGALGLKITDSTHQQFLRGEQAEGVPPPRHGSRGVTSLFFVKGTLP